MANSPPYLAQFSFSVVPSGTTRTAVSDKGRKLQFSKQKGVVLSQIGETRRCESVISHI